MRWPPAPDRPRHRPVAPTPLPAGSGEDLEVTGLYTVGAGTSHYGHVNIYGDGLLHLTTP
jgi:hypothetical protein